MVVTKKVNNWIHNRPKKFYTKAIELFGNPTFCSNVKNGMAYWKTRGLFKEHLLRDEDIKHCVPANHYDYFYSTIEFYVPPEKRLDVLSISGSINYDGLKKTLTARCASIEANIATLYLGMSVGYGSMKIKDVKKQGLYSKYIRGEVKPYSVLRKEMMKMKRIQNKKYEKNMKDPFDKLAFEKCYKPKTKSRRKSKQK